MDTLQGKRLLLLGSNLWKDDIKRFAKERGVYREAVSKEGTGEESVGPKPGGRKSDEVPSVRAFLREETAY